MGYQHNVVGATAVAERSFVDDPAGRSTAFCSEAP
jgi:hypothetical protein